MAGYNFYCGLGAWAVRAGSIGRDARCSGESTQIPPEAAGDIHPRPIHAEITASWFQAERTGPQALAALGNYAKHSSETGRHPSLKDYASPTSLSLPALILARLQGRSSHGGNQFFPISTLPFPQKGGAGFVTLSEIYLELQRNPSFWTL